MTDHASSSPARRSAGGDSSIEILPPLGVGAGDGDAWTCTPADIALPPELEFDTVKRIGGRNANADRHDPAEIRDSILRKLDAIERPAMIEIAGNAEKRAAYELLNGAMDWSKYE